MARTSTLFLALTTLMLGCGESPAPEAPSPQAEAEQAPAAEAAPKEEAPAEAEAEEAKECCCWYINVGNDLNQFSADRSEWPLPEPEWEEGCGGPYWLVGCVDSGICDVAKTPEKPMAELGKVTLTLESGTTVSVPGSSEQNYLHGSGKNSVRIIYYPHPAKKVMAQWNQEVLEQGFTAIKVDHTSDGAAEVKEWHGEVASYKMGNDSLIADFEEGCQGSSGTCVWITIAADTGADGTAPADGEPSDGPQDASVTFSTKGQAKLTCGSVVQEISGEKTFAIPASELPVNCKVEAGVSRKNVRINGSGSFSCDAVGKEVTCDKASVP